MYKHRADSREVWSETEQQHEELGDANTMKKTENT